MNPKITKRRGIFWLYHLIPVLCFTPLMSSPIALGSGILLALFSKNLLRFDAQKLTPFLLQTAIVLMGFGMNLNQVIATSKTGLYLTVFSVFFTILGGLALGKFLKIDRNTTLLISCGTAICGGSAIAAISPIINARNDQLTFSLTVVFVLNALALLLFPHVGHLFGFSQETFGFWSAIAIHDTSSVVGASASYGAKALEIATTVKLTRALWIIPLSIGLVFFNKKNEHVKINIPWFIGLFVLAILFSHFIPQWNPIFHQLNWLGKKGMLLALFFIGASLKKEDLKTAGLKPFLLGVALWIAISVSSFVVLTRIMY